MSAMRAEDLPAVPAALPQDSARTRAAARWTGPGQAAPAAAPPGHATAAPGHAAAPPGHATAAPGHAAAAPGHAAHPSRPARRRPCPSG